MLKKIILMITVFMLCSCSIKKPNTNGINDAEKENTLEDKQTEAVYDVEDAMEMLPVFDSLIRANYEDGLDYSATD